MGEPDSGAAAGLVDLLGDPLEVFTGAGVSRQANEAVAELGDAQALEFAPDGDARSGGLTGDAVRQQHPLP
jgi:hypothetical protein